MIPAYAGADLSFSYGGPDVFFIPRLDIPAGKVTVLVGPNGCGKSTLLHLLAFINLPTRGEIRFFGEAVDPKNLAAFRRRVGILFQNPYLFHSSVLANVEWGLKIRGVRPATRRELAAAALNQVGLSGFESRPSRRLSGGEIQRVALARVLALDPEVLLLDEPLTHVDRQSAQRIEEIVTALNREKEMTILITTHDLLKGLSLTDTALTLLNGSLHSAPLINLFAGSTSSDGKWFDTGRLKIHLADQAKGSHLAIAPEDIVVSKASFPSSMRNSFQGTISGIVEKNGRVQMEVDAGERFQVFITRESLSLLDFRFGEKVWLSFKSTAVKVF